MSEPANPASGGPSVSATWTTSQNAVSAFRDFCTSQHWVFAESPEQADFGKDGYVDVSGDDNSLTGFCVAVQIKGGTSFRRTGGFVIPAGDQHREYWKFSTVPVFGVVWDPDSGDLHWVNITRLLWDQGVDAPIRIPESNRLPKTKDAFSEAVFSSSVGNEVAASLGSNSRDRQMAALSDCFALGRTDARYLVLIRRVMFGLDPAALDQAIHILNDCSLNNEILRSESWIPRSVIETVRPELVWTTQEAIALLSRVQNGDWFERGSFSLCIYWLLVGPDLANDSNAKLIRRATLEAVAQGNQYATKWGLFLCVYWAGNDGGSTLDELLSLAPTLDGTDVVEVLRKELGRSSRIEI